MTSVTPLFEHGPITYTVSAAVDGGQLVAPDTTTGNEGKVKPAGASSTSVLGVAITPAQPNTDGATGTTTYGAPVVDASWPDNDVAVAYRGVFKLTAAANCSFGDLLVAAADGQVTPYTSGTTTYDAVVGRCVDPAGIASGARGKVLLGSVAS